MVIDSHHHFWRYTAREYGWIDDSMSEIRRDFLPTDLRSEMEAAGVVSVQARTTLEETRWLLELAASNPFISAVVGWVQLADPGLDRILSGLRSNPRMAGVREVLQGRPDEVWEDPGFLAGVARLPEFNLAYDILIFHDQLRAATAFVDRFPRQTFVLDHVAKPAIRDSAIEPWGRQIRELAQRPNVFCKVSGMVTEAGPFAADADRLRPYFDVVLDAFGPSRLMFGSDWPVCLVRTGYAGWMRTVRSWAGQLTPAEQAGLFGGNACRAYGILS